MTQTAGDNPTGHEAWVRLVEHLGARGERRLVLVEGDRDSGLAWLRQLLPKLSPSPGIWTGPGDENPLAELTEVPPAKARDWLGRELSVVVWDGWQGNPPDGLAAIAGTLKAGGLLFWLMPPLDEWNRFADPDYRRTGLDSAEHHPFAHRMATILASDSDVIRVDARDPGRTLIPTLQAPDTPFTVATTDDQQRLINQLVHFGQGRRRRPLVVTADRGRGKSAALGIAAARLLQQGRERILVTAPSRESVDTLFHHARQTLGTDLATDDGNSLLTRAGAELRFLPVQELLTQRLAAEVVLVDEAAAIPPQVLEGILLGWPRVAFCSTVHGYEGAGRGFAIRFRSVLDRETQHWQSATLTQPVRWATGDPLEALASNLFLLSASGMASDDARVPARDIRIDRWFPADAPEPELAEAFGLLVDAHYRTTPADLRQWLDDPSAVSWCAWHERRIVGVLWGAIEGGLDEELAQKVTRGQRRIRGHLLAQSLASHSGFPEAAIQSTLRVVRVAVASPARRSGVGKRLVAVAREWVSEQELDGLGTSFGGSPELLAFWQSCGMNVVRVGFQRENTSGEYPLQMLAGSSPQGVELVDRLRGRLARHWLTLVPRHWCGMSAELLAAISDDLPATRILNDDDRRDLDNFAHGHRGFDFCLPVLRELGQVPGVMNWLRTRPELALWVGAVLQGRFWAEAQAAGLCRGQRDGEQRLRTVVRELLENGPEM
ncbi:tRNA(Met) cytidine acetyltransferase TmcA [Marinobacter pelagius]|uniref:tRNA(Met) cytidine acetyltransferase TmcA n=1 Tax=Marinobacter pelagius TaxID=379482 RepID=A0A1I4S4D4_9GAMM|nr:GNAT family N-acetyltransferase [Marinobacter pelagius]SFM59376.1 tRNA(Met)-cytidine N(4)-acetyltransferase [Marinobacter pelagius]